MIYIYTVYIFLFQSFPDYFVKVPRLMTLRVTYNPVLNKLNSK